MDNESNSRCHKRNLTGKRKKKKKRRKGEENSSDSDSEFMSKQRDSKCGQSLSPRRREELPDIIPKQVKTKKINKIKLKNKKVKTCCLDNNNNICLLIL